MVDGRKVLPKEGKACVKVLRQTREQYWRMTRDHSSRESPARDEAIEVGSPQIRQDFIEKLRILDLRNKQESLKGFNQKSDVINVYCYKDILTIVLKTDQKGSVLHVGKSKRRILQYPHEWGFSYVEDDWDAEIQETNMSVE